jgi:hypothetical protein
MLLDERLDTLTTDSLARLELEEPAYAGVTLDPALKRSGMRRTLELALSRLAGGPVPESVARATEDIGRERAEQGFPLPALMHSFQLDLRILWEAVVDEGRERSLSTDQAFIDSLILVWEATDANSVEVVDAYRRTERDLASHRVEIRGRAFERLVLEGELDSTTVTEASARLAIAIDSSLVVLVAESVPTRDDSLMRCRDDLQRAGFPFHFSWLGDELLGIVDRGHRPESRVVEILQRLDQWRCGLSTVEGLAAVPRGIRLARAVIRSDASPGVRLIQAHWIGTVMAHNEELGGTMAQEILSPIMALRERDGIFETLHSYLRTGSIAEVATLTYRHRNTVRNRLQTVERATGLTLARPADAALLAMSVEWLRSPAGMSFQRAAVATGHG